MTSISDDKIFNKLAKIDPEVAKIYHGAIVVLGDKSNPDRIAQSAHSIRETLNRLTGKIDIQFDKRKQKKTKKKDTLKQKLIKTFDPLGGPSSEFQESYKQLTRLHEWFVNTSHHGNIPTEMQFLKKLEEYQSCLQNFFEPYFNVIDKIDSLLIKQTPTPEDVNKLKNLTITFASLKYFFDNADEKWLLALKQNGIFLNPPTIDLDRNIIPMWSASKFLLKMASKQPGIICDIILSCKMPKKANEKNIYVIEDFLEIAKIVPLEYSIKLSRHFLKDDWIHTPYLSQVYDKALNLASKLLDENIYDGKKIIDSLLSIKRVPKNCTGREISEYYKEFQYNPFEKISNFTFTKIKEDYIPVLLDKFPESTTKTLIQALDEIMSNYLTIDKIFVRKRLVTFLSGRPKDELYSAVWLQAIDDHSNSNMEDVKVSLVSIILSGLTKIGENDPKKLKQFVTTLPDREFNIFKRIQLYFYALYPELFKKEIDEALFQYIDEIELYHEHYVLIKSTFQSRTKTLRKRYVKRINEYVNSSKFNRLIGSNLSKERVRALKDDWKLRKFEPIYQYLPSQEKKWYDENKKDDNGFIPKGQLFHSEFYSDVKEGKDIGLTSNMKPNEVLGLLKEYVVSEDYKNSSDDITSAKFKELVKRDPLGYTALADEFKTVNTEYCYHLLDSLRDVSRNNGLIDWTKVIDLCLYLSKPENDPFGRGTLFLHGSNPIANFLLSALQNENIELSHKFRKKIWTIAMLLLQGSLTIDDRRPERKDFDIDSDYSFHIINSSIGNSVQLILQYGLWCTIYLHTKCKKYILVPEVRNTLDSLLESKNSDINCSIAMVLNNFLIPSDEQWVKNNLSKIFPSIDSDKQMYYAIWECYLKYNSPTRQAFNLMYSLYEERIGNLKKDPSNYYDSQANRAFVRRIFEVYINDLEYAQKMFDMFIEQAPTKLISVFLDDISKFLRINKSKGLDKRELDKIQQIWDRKELESHIELLDWFIESPFDKTYSLKKLHASLVIAKNNNSTIDYSTFDEIGNELANYMDIDKHLVLDCLLLLAETTTNTGMLNGIKDVTLRIIGTCKNETDPKILSKIDTIKNYFGSCGFDEFRNIK